VPDKKTVKLGLIYCAVFALLAGALFPSSFQRLENSAYDLHMRTSGLLASEDVIIVAIDDESIDVLDTFPTRDLTNAA